MHWTGRGMNWNYMCADCHATAVRKNYIADADSFDTKYSELGVGCEGCHGAGERHAEWGKLPAWARRIAWRDPRLPARLDERKGVTWSIDSASGNARRSAPRTSDRELDVCAQCHARRVHLAEGYTAGAPLLDYYDPLVLVPGLYHPDGQQEDEVYNHASFLQSRMHAFGVTCADCHDPHTQKLRRPGNEVCGQCHRLAQFGTGAHHGHARFSAGGQCASCHMPVTTYLEIDGRHDHSLRVPRPDRTAAFGVPNACNACHPARDARWAAGWVWPMGGRSPYGFQRFAESFARDEQGAAGAMDSLVAIVRDHSHPAVVRASALARLARYTGDAVRSAAAEGAKDPDPLVRRWALAALEGVPPLDRIPVASPLLADSLRAVRLAAAWLLAPVADSLPTPERRADFARASDEFIASQRYNADRAEHRVTLGAFLLARGDTAAGVEEFRAAARQWPRNIAAIVNLAGVAALQGREAEAERLIREALQRMPDEAELHHELGRSLARQGRMREGVAAVQRAVRLAPSDVAYARTLTALKAELKR
ncbi:MAG: tetratricopeptide repeat protein [Gemmatimonadota bacterium]